MKQTIKDHVNKCSQCKLNKITRHTREKYTLTTTPQKPFDDVSIDTVGPLPTTANGNKYAITAQCNLTKYLIVIPIQNKEAATIARALVDNVILQYGQIQKIITDLGTEYTATVFNETIKLLGMEHATSTAYHPQTIGALERSHRVLNEYLRHYIDGLHEWDYWLKFFQFAYNSTPHSSHNFTPFELLYGRNINIPSTITTNVDPVYNLDDYNNELKYRLQFSWQRANKLLHADKEKRINKQNQTNAIQLTAGDKVKLLREARHKLEPRYTGPHVVLDVQGQNVTIKVNDKPITVHKDRLRLY